jgi:cobaltochelatase CobT
MEGPVSSGGDRIECGHPQDLKQGDGGQENRGPENHPPSAVQRDPQHFPAPQSSAHSESQGVEPKCTEARANGGDSETEESLRPIYREPKPPDEGSLILEGSRGRKRKDPQDKTLKRIFQASESELTRDFGEMLAERLACEGEPACKDGFHMAVAIPPPAAVASQIGQEVSQQTRALRVRLDGLIQASRLTRARLAPTGLRINTRELYRLSLSDPRVFSRYRKRKAVNTAVQILLDKSGSMRHRLEIARRAAMAVACALQCIRGTAVACAAFPVPVVRNAVGILPLTRFDERVAVTASHYESFDAQGGTPLAEALWWCASEILGRREERKMILVVTDGQPDDSESAREIIQRCLNSGIEMIGLGIEVQAVKVLFPDWCVIQDIEQLAPAMFKVLERKLTRGFTESA